MANEEHLAILKQGASAWNSWRKENPDIIPDLSNDTMSKLERAILFLSEAVMNEVMPQKSLASNSEFSDLDLSKINLSGANLAGADFSGTSFILADLSNANLSNANMANCVFTSANLEHANFENATLNGAILRFAKLKNANFQNCILRLANLNKIDAVEANFQHTDLSFTSLNEANLNGANLSNSFVYGLSAWNVQVEGTIQKDLRITRTNEGLVTVDDIKIAQFIYMLLNNKNIRDAIDSLTTKLVLILGRFTDDRKLILNGIKQQLNDMNYVPVLFDFDRPSSRDFTETVVTLAHMARFIIADITAPRSIAKELEAIVPRLAIPIQPLIAEEEQPYAMFGDYWKYDWVLEIHKYADLSSLLDALKTKLINQAEMKFKQLLIRRNEALGKL